LAIVKDYARNLQSIGFLRRSREWDVPKPPIEDDSLLAQREKLAVLKRLCTYHSEIDMRSMWERLAEREFKNTNLTMNGLLQSPDDRIALVVQMIFQIIRKFEKLPKLTPADRRKTITKTINALSKALDAIQSDPWAKELSRFMVPDYIGLKNLEMRAQNGESINHYYASVPRFAIAARMGDAERLPGDPAWDDLPVGNRYALLASAIEGTNIEDVLESMVSSLAATLSAPTEISQPGRDDQGFVPYLIRELSAVMQSRYKQPLHETVALLVSAIANLEYPLDSDGVRPYLR